MKTLLDGIFALIITGLGCLEVALSGQGVSEISDLSSAQIAKIFIAAILASLKTMHSYRADPNA